MTDGFTLLVGDVRDRLRELPDGSVHCVVTSPPYFGLRDYGTGEWEGGDPGCDHLGPPKPTQAGFNERYFDRPSAASDKQADLRVPFREACGRCGARRVDRQIGLESSPAEYVAAMVEVFREVRRVLRGDGTVWLNLGDSYATQPRKGANVPQTKHPSSGYPDAAPHRSQALDGMKPKDMLGIPWAVACALRDDGWWLRADIIWWKVNPMPASVTDRPTTAHEHVFLLAKAPRYFYDGEAVKEPSAQPDRVRSDRVGGANGHTVRHSPGGVMEGVASRNMRGVWEIARQAEDEAAWLADVFADAMRAGDEPLATTVWRIATQPYPAAHFATFPVELPSRAIRAGTSEKGCCRACGAPWARIVEKGEPQLAANTYSLAGQSQYDLADGGRSDRGTLKQVRANRTAGWQPTCACDGVDRTPIATPLGESPLADPTLEVGRAGFERERGDEEGVRWITRYEQQQYAMQLGELLSVVSPARRRAARAMMETEAGDAAFAHYCRTDRSGARPVPHLLLESWIERGFLDRVEVPPPPDVDVRPCVVLDPFAGSGTTAVAALRLGRHAVGVELSPEYAALCEARVARWWKDPARAPRPAAAAQPALFDDLTPA